VIVAWLLKPNALSGKIIRSLELELHTPYKAIDELWAHKSLWTRKNPAIELDKFVDQLQYYVNIHHVSEFPKMREAEQIMAPIDPDDTEFLALALMLDTPIWSYDAHFGKQNKIRTLSTAYILRNSPDIPTLWEELKEEYFKIISKRPRTC
jgi:predicted nucleic acid-binding protein